MKLKASYLVLFTATLAALVLEGRTWWCACGEVGLWSGDIWSSHNSQHLLDPYSFTHVLHGVLFFFAGWLLLPKVSAGWKLWLATLVECAWEVAENSAFIIHRYREVTISLGYEGDSIINALADIGCCVLGYVMTQRLGLRRSVVAFAVTEVVLLLTIRDNLTLNVLMLVWPIEAVKAWQMVH